MQRRDFLLATGAGLGLVAVPAARSRADARPSLPLVRAESRRIIAMTVCSRPFRAAGPRVEAERLGRKTVVHNYGHGGSGWSLSWGSSTLAVRIALAARRNELAVIGCGVLGLTSAIVAQRAGLNVRIYAKERPPEVRSTLATGNWSPASRFCVAEGATPDVAARWEEMARTSFRAHQQCLGLPGDPVEWRDFYQVRDEAFDSAQLRLRGAEPRYASLEGRIADLVPGAEELPPDAHPFPTPQARRFPNMVFNLNAYLRLLMSEFLIAGGEIETREFTSPGDLAKLRERTLINATGYGARALFGDESVVPVRGQLLRLMPQPEVTHGLIYNGALFMVPRRDGIIVQTRESDEFGSEDTTPVRAEAERALQMLSDLNARMRG